MLYGMFLLSLAIGLAGASLFLHRLYETVLLNWDPVAEIAQAIRERREKRMRRRLLPEKEGQVGGASLQTRSDRTKYHKIEMETAAKAPAPKQELEDVAA